MLCKQCGVELEPDMQVCPLCRTPLTGKPVTPTEGSHQLYVRPTPPGKKFTWEIVSLTLFCSAITTVLVNLITDKSISWSEYPVSLCMVVFCYTSVFSFLSWPWVFRLMTGLILSCIGITLLDTITSGIQWSTRLGVPLLVAGSAVVAGLAGLFRSAAHKGVNLIAYCFAGAVVLCLLIDGILSVYRYSAVQFNWSIIVAACVLPVIIVLLFLHFRLKRGRSLEKTFHI